MRAYNDKFKFIVGFCIGACALVGVTATLLVAEVYVSGDRMLADVEIANNSPVSTATATATPK